MGTAKHRNNCHGQPHYTGAETDKMEPSYLLPTVVSTHYKIQLYPKSDKWSHFLTATANVNTDGENSIYFMANSDPFKSGFLLVWKVRFKLKGNEKPATRKRCACSLIHWKPWSGQLKGRLADMG